jgi:hypothetical protein
VLEHARLVEVLLHQPRDGIDERLDHLHDCEGAKGEAEVRESGRGRW